jgi:hypothetical protein
MATEQLGRNDDDAERNRKSRADKPGSHRAKEQIDRTEPYLGRGQKVSQCGQGDGQAQ